MPIYIPLIACDPFLTTPLDTRARAADKKDILLKIIKKYLPNA